MPPDGTLIRDWKRWEAGDAEPDDFYRPLIAKTFATVTRALFPSPHHQACTDGLVDGAGMDTLEVVSRLRAADVSPSTLDALRVTVERLCSEYPYKSSDELRLEGQTWLRRLTALLDQPLTLAQHREVLTLAGWVALLVGCVEYDMGDRRASESTRQAALSLGEEADHAEIVAWAHEMEAWQALTSGDYRGVIAASETGQSIAPTHGVSVQLAAQKAKAWARVGDRRQVEVALDAGRTLLESLPYPENLDNHFVVNPAKYDFYAMDCYRILGENRLAEAYAHEVIDNGTAFDGTERSPMRIAEARVTLGVLAARDGDAEQAIYYGEEALGGHRKSLPSLRMCSRELASILHQRYSGDSHVTTYLDHLRTLRPV